MALALLLVLTGPVFAQTPDPFNPGANGHVLVMAVQPDGKIVVGGSFSSLAGQTAYNIGRLNNDGTLDTAFAASANDTYVGLVSLQTDGKILVAGNFSMLASQPCSYFGRLNANGSLDGAFNPGVDSYVNCVVEQADGKLLVGGRFTVLGGQQCQYIGQLNADGTLDTTFQAEVNGSVNCLAIQADGKIVIGGIFTAVAGQPRNYIARLAPNGSLDEAFDPGSEYDVEALAIQPDGKILVAGAFFRLAGQNRQHIGRLNSDGSLDESFNPSVDRPVSSLALQADGKILVAGSFNVVDEHPRVGLGRLNPDGKVDADFKPEANGNVFALALQPDGKVLLGGSFTELSGNSRQSIGRLNNTDPATQTVVLEGETLYWLRGGAAPELWRTTFEGSTNGTDWESLGAGARTPGGWRLTGFSLSANATLRARGFVAGANQYGGNWFVERIVTWQGNSPPMIEREPVSRTNNAGTRALFAVEAAGTAPLMYQWRKGTEYLPNGANLTGARESALVLSNVFGADAGEYSVIVSNAHGSVTSLVANLSVVDPILTTQPVGQAVQQGQTALLGVLGVGTLPLSYQWRKDGIPLSGATNSSLAVSNFTRLDVGDYEVILSNVFGSVTSTTASLRMLATPDTFDPQPAGSVYALAVQTDGIIIVGGSFSRLGGQPRRSLGRLNPDGTLDPTFDPGPDNQVNSIAIQADNRIVVGGAFMKLGGQTRSRIGRLNGDGTVDTTFNPGANSHVFSIALQRDGKILAGGGFSQIAGQERRSLVRFNEDGTLDPSFGAEALGAAACLALQADGKILVGGYFTTLAGQARSYLGRLDTDGSLDMSFDPGPDGDIYSMAVQGDGKILLGGKFTQMAGKPRSHIARLNPDGTLDEAFDPGADGFVFALALQTDGKILVGGSFTNLVNQPCAFLGRLNSDGTLDMVCDAASSGLPPAVRSVALQPDGDILVGGTFSRLAGQVRNNLARLDNNDLASQTLLIEESRIVWWRSGASPEVWSVYFDGSTNGGEWIPLGPGTRVPDGWLISKPGLPMLRTVRARGFAQSKDSAWLTEAFAGLPFVTNGRADLTNQANTAATFAASAVGTEPLSYRWHKGGVPLSDGSNVFGSQTPSLTLRNVLGGDVGEYSVVISNTYGSITNAGFSLTVMGDPYIITQPINQAVTNGQNAALSVVAGGTPPLKYQWRKSGTDISGANTASLVVTNVRAGDLGSYDVVVSSSFGSVTSLVATLIFPVTVDDFDPGVTGSPINTSVYSLAVQLDGKVLIGGAFTSIAGQTRECLARLNADGTLDTSFDPSAAGTVYSLAVQPDSRILVAGNFTNLCQQSRHRLARLNPDGTLDPGFNPGADSTVYSVVALPDGKILMGGLFSTVAGQQRKGIARVNSDGTLDQEFNPGTISGIYSLALQRDGKILVGGNFSTMGGQPRERLGRLNADGTLDVAFNPGASYGVPTAVHCLSPQRDGKILVGGNFTLLGGQPRNHFGRLNADGTPDPDFNPSASGAAIGVAVFSIAQQADGKILIGGNFTAIGGKTHRSICRLNSDGSTDEAFQAGAAGGVNAVALQPDGKVLVGGAFTMLQGIIRNRVGRLETGEPAIQSLSIDGPVARWFRGQSSPEVSSTVFDVSTNGSDWLPLGAGTAFAGGWQLTGVPVPRNSSVRARGWVAQGYQNGSSWLVEQISGLPAITGQPSNLTNNAGTVALFSVLAGGVDPLSFSWLKNGLPVSAGALVSGVHTSTLALSNVLRADAGAYSVVISNVLGVTTSAVATLTVLDPAINGQPRTQVANVRLPLTLTVDAGGTPPLNYQWRRNGNDLVEATSPTYFVDSAEWSDAGAYDVCVRNGYGGVTSAVATVTINLAPPDTFNPGTNSTAFTTVPQLDGKVILGGSSMMIGGQLRGGVRRVLSDGTFDSSFDLSGDGVPIVYALSLDEDDGVLVGGDFSGLEGEPRHYLARLKADGSLDPDFAPGATSGSVQYVNCIAIQTNGKILAGGFFTLMGGQHRANICRLNSDGTADTTFNSGVDGVVRCLLAQPDEKILVAGGFTLLGGEPCNNLGRLNPDGTRDTTFNVEVNNAVNCAVLQPDGKIVIGGYFSAIGGVPGSCLARLNPDGTLDPLFQPAVDAGSLLPWIESMVLQADGKILVGGRFTRLGGETRNHLGRLNSDGTLDGTFNAPAVGKADTIVYSLALQADGALLVSGLFNSLAGMPRTNLGRLQNSTPAVQHLSFDGATITWTRSGAGPELLRSFFDMSTNGADWVRLGDGARIPGGWQLTQVLVPPGAWLRARGYAAGGRYNGSAYLMESELPGSTPIIMVQPQSQTVSLGTDVFLSVGVAGAGTGQFSYQWWFAGAPMHGQTNDTLSLLSVQKTNTGAYWAVVRNEFGSVTTREAYVRVLAPPVLEAPLLLSEGVRLLFRDSDGGLPTDLSGVEVQWRSSFGTGTDWEALASECKVANGFIAITDTNTWSQPTRFYRVLKR